MNRSTDFHKICCNKVFSEMKENLYGRLPPQSIEIWVNEIEQRNFIYFRGAFSFIRGKNYIPDKKETHQLVFPFKLSF